MEFSKYYLQERCHIAHITKNNDKHVWKWSTFAQVII